MQIIGCDNVAFFAKRPADFRERVRPLLNSGGLVEYPRGAGGIVLANLLFKDTEEVPVNAVEEARACWRRSCGISARRSAAARR